MAQAPNAVAQGTAEQFADASSAATQGLGLFGISNGKQRLALAQVAKKFLDTHEHVAFVKQELGGIDNVVIDAWAEPLQAAFSLAEGASDFVAIAKSSALSGALQLYNRTDLEIWGVPSEAVQAVAASDGTASILERQQLVQYALDLAENGFQALPATRYGPGGRPTPVATFAQAGVAPHPPLLPRASIHVPVRIATAHDARTGAFPATPTPTTAPPPPCWFTATIMYR